MKKLVVVFLTVFLIAGTAFAQPIIDDQNAGKQSGENRQRARNNQITPRQRLLQQREIETLTINGILKLEKGVIVLESGENTYGVPVLHRYTGFIDGLKEGASVSITGRLFRNMLYAQELTIDGKKYDIAPGALAQDFRHLEFPRQQFSPRRDNLPNRGNPGRGRNTPNRGDNAPRRPAQGACRCGSCLDLQT